MMPAEPKKFKAGEYIFNEGEASTSIFIIQEGLVSIRKKKGDVFVEIARLGMNEVLGELSFFDRKPRSASALALSDSTVLEIDFQSLDKIYATVPDYIKTIMSAVAARLRRADDIIRQLKQETVAEFDITSSDQ